MVTVGLIKINTEMTFIRINFEHIFFKHIFVVRLDMFFPFNRNELVKPNLISSNFA